MSTAQHRNETNTAKLPPLFVPTYPTWVKELIDQKLDDSIASRIHSGPDYRTKFVEPVKPKPR